jgi:TolB protein
VNVNSNTIASRIMDQSVVGLRVLALLAVAGLALGCEEGSMHHARSKDANGCTTAQTHTSTGSMANSNAVSQAYSVQTTTEPLPAEMHTMNSGQPTMGMTTEVTAMPSGMNSGIGMNTTTTTSSSMMTPPKTTYRPGQKLEPFWISMIAEADRAVWDDQFKPGKGMDVLSTRTAPNMPTPRPTGEDGAEGLSHVTYASEGADFDPCVSRDSKYIAYASTQHRPTSDIYIKGVNGRTVTQLTSDPGNDVMPAFSPDGSRIAFCSNRNGNWDVFVMSISGGQALQLSSDPSHELHPTWSPDSKKIAFCRLGETSGRWEMWVMDVAGTGASEFIGYGMFPQWCPIAKTGMDGRDRILFQRSRERGDHAFSVWTIDYRPGDASSPTEIASAQGQALINAAWAPDGERIVYATIPNPNDIAQASEKMPQSTLWMTGVDGTQKVLLTSGPFMNLMPSWCADGRIYFVSDRTGVPNIWSIGTEKAITAATGKRPERASNTDFANKPGKNPHAATPAVVPAHETPAPTPTEVTGAHEPAAEPGHEN